MKNIIISLFISICFSTKADDSTGKFTVLMETGSCFATFTQNLENSFTEITVNLSAISLIEEDESLTLQCVDYHDCISKYTEVSERDVIKTKSEFKKYINFDYQTESDDSLPNILESKIELCSKEEKNNTETIYENYNPFCEDGTISPIVQGCEPALLY